MRALYAAEVTMVDRWLGRFLDKLESTGLVDDTMLILLSDHGVALGEHGATGKPFGALWPELTDIPFFIRHPEGLGAGETSDFIVSTHDVAPTILGALGVLPPVQMQGRYLTLLLQGAELEPRPHFTLGYDAFVWARDDRYVMFGPADRSEARLFDVQSDPNMDNDIAADNADVVRRMFEDYVLEDAGGSLPVQ
jgi:arylsulfatase A-like enzyme